MSDRSRLHELIDTLPEAALRVAQGALEHFQSWPNQKPAAQLAAIQEARMDRIRRSSVPGTVRTGGGGGGHFMGPDGRIEYGNHSFSFWESDTVVVTIHRYHAGHELVIEERMRLLNDGAGLLYSHSVTGPDTTTSSREITFKISPNHA